MKDQVKTIESIIGAMVMVLKEPEEKIINQYDVMEPGNTDRMYFIAKGKCSVVVRDQIE
jgi:hypothetical protein